MSYQNHIKSIYGTYMGQGPPPMLQLGLCHIKPISNPYMGHIWVTPLPQLGLWTFEPAFSPRFLPTLSLRSFFPTGQRFLPTLSLRSIFSNWSAVFTHLEPTILFSHWSAVSPFKSRDFRLPMSPRSFLSNGPRFPTPEML